MHVVELVPREATPAQWAAVADAFNPAWLAHAPSEPPWPARYFEVAVTHVRAHRPTRGFLATDGDVPAGYLEYAYSTVPENRHRVDVELYVSDPAAADALLDVAEHEARAYGARVVGAWLLEGSESIAACEKRGGSLAQVEQRNVLDLHAVNGAQVRAWAAEAHPDYSLVRWDGGVPAEWEDEFVAMHAVMNDAPFGTLDMEEWHPDIERLNENARVFAARGDRLWTIAARHDESGHLAGFTELGLVAEHPWLVDQEDTAVARDHRGHGLGRWVKAANIVRLLDEAPEARWVQTWNADDNEHMIAVNRELGFQCASKWEAWDIPVS